MAVDLTKPVQPETPFGYVHSRQWRATVDCAIQVGQGCYADLIAGRLQALREAFAIKIYDALPGPTWREGSVDDIEFEFREFGR